MSEYVEGKLLIIGGAEDKEGECTILKRFVQEAGGTDSIIAILTAATEYPEQVGSQYQELFHKFGAKQVFVLDISRRHHANNEELAKLLAKVSGVFFTGGDQLRITGMLGGTVLGRMLHQLYERGVVIAGTSAGASVMSDTMIVGGDSASPKKEAIVMAPGLGLLRAVIIDQHFAQRGRIGRLLAAVAQNPYVLGVGIDEDTAILVYPDGRLTVVGSQTVIIVDASPSVATNVSESSPGEALVLTPVLMHVLSNGLWFDFKKRVALL